MLDSGSFSLKNNPQYYIKFCQDDTGLIPTSPVQPNESIICWVVISKLLVMHADGTPEEEENSSDYLAMHVYPNSNIGEKVLEDRNAIVRSVYSPEQTIMLYLTLSAGEYFNINKVLNLVLD